MSSWPEIVAEVYARAGDRCEFCKMHQALQGASFHVEHVIPSVRGGLTQPENLALACPSCNLHKSDRTEVVDPQNGVVVPLFNPRRDDWHDHFRWNGYQLEGLTAIGRVTIVALKLDAPRRITIRQAEEFFELFPP